MASAIYWILGALILWMLFTGSGLHERMSGSPGTLDQLASTSPYYFPSAWGEGYDWPYFRDYDAYYRNPGYNSYYVYPRPLQWSWY